MVLSGLQNGKYRTLAGSVLEISGKHSGIARVEFDWLEENNACIDCQVNPYPEEWEAGVYRLTWICSVCGGGSALLFPHTKLRRINKADE